MMCELSQDEMDFLEQYRDLLPEFQAPLRKKAADLFAFQTEVIKMSLGLEDGSAHPENKI